MSLQRSELSSKEVAEIQRLKRIAQHTSNETKKRYGLTTDDVMILCKYMTGDLLDNQELDALLPLVSAIRNQIQTHPTYHYKKIGLEISSDWTAVRSRIAVDEGAAKMYVAIPVRARADFARRVVETSPFLYNQLIEVVDGYGIDIELPTKVDFIIYEPTTKAQLVKQLSVEDNFILKMIKQKHLTEPEGWQRVLFC